MLAELQFGDDRIERHLTSRKTQGASHRTVNADLAAIRSFCRWLLRRERIQRDPTVSLETLNEAEDRRLERRALSEDEAQKLITSTLESEKVFRRLNGEQRAMLYLLALRTGLRRKELRSLMPRSFAFGPKISSVTLHPSDSKRRKQDCLPLPREVAVLYEAYIKDLNPDEPVWPGSWWRKSAEMIKRDMSEAGLSIEDDQGRTFDFHGQRTTFITGLSRAGILPALAQKLARHSNINLTMGTYTSMDLDELGQAVESLPDLTDNTKSAPHVLAQQQLVSIQRVWLELAEDVRAEIMNLIDNRDSEGGT